MCTARCALVVPKIRSSVRSSILVWTTELRWPQLSKEHSWISILNDALCLFHCRFTKFISRRSRYFEPLVLFSILSLSIWTFRDLCFFGITLVGTSVGNWSPYSVIYWIWVLLTIGKEYLCTCSYNYVLVFSRDTPFSRYLAYGLMNMSGLDVDPKGNLLVLKRILSDV